VPDWLREKDVVVEEHAINSLNERFRILSRPPTAGILSVDDDVIRPCPALDAGFILWTQNPHRMVGFDARTHVIRYPNNSTVVPTSSTTKGNAEGRWAYGYLSTTEHSNKYSISLTRFCFLHVDYFDSYFMDMPSIMRDTVDQHFNCEDLAMSLWVSSQTNGKVPLLADYWAVKSQIKLYSEDTISGSYGHKSVRDDCVDMFANVLQLKDRLVPQEFVHTGQSETAPFFDCGAYRSHSHKHVSRRREQLEEKLTHWKKLDLASLHKELHLMVSEIIGTAYERGLIKKSDPWKKRWGKKSKKKRDEEREEKEE
jgi:glucuronyl/N-acetylglucosaminyl transferase EXT2